MELYCYTGDWGLHGEGTQYLPLGSWKASGEESIINTQYGGYTHYLRSLRGHVSDSQESKGAEKSGYLDRVWKDKQVAI